jgi:glycosyltransferase involved in cell wall biosynthesis
MNIAIYNLHLAVLGGGERRSALLAAHLCKANNVWLFVQSPIGKDAILEVFGIDLSGVTIVSLEEKDHLAEIARISPDLFINNSYGSTLPSIAPAGIYMCMFPNLEKIDLASYGVVTANSEYTAKWILEKWGYRSEVVYSACQFMGPAHEKQNIILNVGRFFEDAPDAHHKRQDILVEAFGKLLEKGKSDWQLHLIGRVGDTARDRCYLERVKSLSERYPVKILNNIDFDRLRLEYRRAAIYWHATGFGSDQNSQPGKQEHFGMSIVEAMSAGAVPFAFDAGGPRETIRPGINGHLWRDVDELVDLTRRLISTPARMNSMSATAVADSRHFGAEGFLARMDAIIARLTN